MRSLSPACRVLVLLVLLVSLAPRPALAKGPTRSVSYKTLLKEVSRLYEDLEYERALEVLRRAEREAEIPRKDRLWLLMMRGVLHYVLKQQAEADAAFRRLLEQAPDARLTLRSASKTLKDHFERLRRQVLLDRALAKEPRPQPRHGLFQPAIAGGASESSAPAYSRVSSITPRSLSSPALSSTLRRA